MQYSTRIHIKVSSPKVWFRFLDFSGDLGDFFEPEELAYSKETSYVSDGIFAYDGSELLDLVFDLSKVLGEDGIILADTTDLDTDPGNFCVFCMGGDVRSEKFFLAPHSDAPHEKCRMHHETDIHDIPGWLSYGQFPVSPEEDEILMSCEICAYNGQFYAFSPDLTLPERSYLRETSFENRSQAIEQLQLSDELTLLPSPDSFDPLRLEVMSPHGSVGFLPSEVGEQLTPLLWKDRLRYSIRLDELVPLSRRNPRARSSFVAIHIEAEMTRKRSKRG